MRTSSQRAGRAFDAACSIDKVRRLRSRTIHRLNLPTIRVLCRKFSYSELQFQVKNGVKRRKLLSSSMSEERRTTEELLFELEQVKRADEDHFQSLLDEMGAPPPLAYLPQAARRAYSAGHSGRPCITVTNGVHGLLWQGVTFTVLATTCISPMSCLSNQQVPHLQHNVHETCRY